ncbi:MAG: hypothetical protein JNM17_22420, partial [Archangium sp.]|nr:hypothetical protein [Archangium sp.]
VTWKLASLVSWLFVYRPVGCAVRAGIPKVVDALRATLGDGRNVWVLESKYWDELKPAQRRKHHAAMTDLVGGQPLAPPRSRGDWLEGRDDGVLILAPCAPDANSDAASVFGAFYTAKLSPLTEPRIDAYARAISGWNEFDVLATAHHVVSDGFAALGARVMKTTVPAKGYEANPAVSAPRLVERVAGERGVSPEAATLLLQTLALPAPTTANVELWNGWVAKQYDAAARELIAARLLVTASVPKAGRKLFAPGQIVKNTKLNLPIEQSKLAWTRHGRFIKHLISEPCDTLFERAYAAQP